MGRHTSGSSWLGSSPRVWGTLVKNYHILPQLRFIPTGVGNMEQKLRSIPAKTVHPHGCGEHSNLLVIRSGLGGSSPRVWGTSTTPLLTGDARRFIPTGVGNISSLARSFLIFPVHPHGCGEHVVSLSVANLFNGSSPRVWGTSLNNMGISTDGRFIPTGVGNIALLWSQHQAGPVHPHGCGEHWSLKLRRQV